jgi:hypothetical protein
MAHHEGAVGLAERFEHHPEGDPPFVAGDPRRPLLAHLVPLLLSERHRGQRDDLLLLIVEVGLDDLIEVAERCRQRFAGPGRGLFAPGRARGRRFVQRGLDEQVLVFDLLGHRGLLGHPLDQHGVEQLVFALVMVVQRRDGEINVIGQERDPLR